MCSLGQVSENRQRRLPYRTRAIRFPLRILRRRAAELLRITFGGKLVGESDVCIYIYRHMHFTLVYHYYSNKVEY